MTESGCPEGFSLTGFAPEHIAQAAETERLCFSDPWSGESLGYLCSSGHTLALACVRDSDGKLAGYCGADCVLDEADIINVAVHPSFRRRGIAEAMLARLISDALEAGVRTFFLEVRESNAPARSLYRKLGFDECGRMPRYYSAPVEDAIVMTRSF